MQTRERGDRLDSLWFDWCRGLGRETALWRPAARQPRHLRGGEVPTKCGVELSHMQLWKLWWRLGKESKNSVGLESKRKGRFTAAALMATAADSVFSGVHKEETRGGFIGQERRKAASPERSGLQEPRHGRQGGWRHAVGLRAVAEGSAPARVCAAAACRRPRGSVTTCPGKYRTTA
jgi:hypothetical protein